MSETTGVRQTVSMREAVGYDRIHSHHETIEGTLVLKHDRHYMLLDERGDVPGPNPRDLGLYQDDTRILSRYQLRLGTGHAAVVLSSHAPTMFGAQIDLALTDRDFGGRAWDPKNVIHIRRELILGDHLFERVSLTNYLTREVEFEIRLDVASDFADIFEVRGWEREERGRFFAPQVEDDTIVLEYEGVDGVPLRTCVRFTAPPSVIQPDGALWRIQLAPNESRELEWQVLSGDGVKEVDGGFDERRARLDADYRDWTRECATWRSDVEAFNSGLDRSVSDLRALYAEAGGEPIPSAGIPWYSTIFGRDSIITSLQTLPLNPRIARDTLLYLAHHQGEREDGFTEEEPGKIMHELRRGELARSGEIPHVPYYGTVDATPLFLILLHETWRWTGDDALVGRLLPNAERALAWIDRYGDRDGDGLVEYARTSEKGLYNQGWKDSHDGISHPDGRVAEAPIALVEVQGYVYDAWTRMAALFAARGEPERAAELQRRALRLRREIVERFWLDDLGTFALALDANKEPVRSATSNAGHLLWSRVPSRAQAERLAEHLLSPAMFSGWGLRTLSERHPVYNPMSYHNGSVWPHDNAIVSLGLSLYEHTDRVVPLLGALHDAACGMRYHRLPELFCGMPRAHGMRPVLYPVSCSPQAWASGSFFMLLQAVTGLLPDAPNGVVHIRQPLLPNFLSSLEVRDLRIGQSRLSIQFRREGRRTVANLLSVEGKPMRVSIEL